MTDYPRTHHHHRCGDLRCQHVEKLLEWAETRAKFHESQSEKYRELWRDEIMRSAGLSSGPRCAAGRAPEPAPADRLHPVVGVSGAGSLPEETT